MPTFITPFSGARRVAVLTQTDLINSVMSLFKQGLAPSTTTVKSELEAEECDFDGYVTKTIAAWTGPVLGASAGYELNGGLLEWIMTTVVVTNQVGGAWLEDAAGNVIQIVKFDDPGQPMVVADDAIRLPPVQFFSALQVSG